MPKEYFALIPSQIRNPKPETRNKSEFQMTKTPNDEIYCIRLVFNMSTLCFGHYYFRIWILFRPALARRLIELTVLVVEPGKRLVLI